MSAFDRNVQDELQQEDVQQDPTLMEDVLNRLAKWQEEAERVHVYDIDSKIQRIMDVMGFMPRFVQSQVSHERFLAFTSWMALTSRVMTDIWNMPF